MPTASGIDTIFGVAREAVHGTYLAPTRFNELIRETIRPNRPRVMSQGMRPGRLTEHRVATGPTSVSGDIDTELFPVNSATLLRNALGAPVSTETSNGSGIYDHVFDPKDISEEWMSVTLARPGFDGTRHTYGASGMQTTSWSIEASAGQDGFVMLKTSLYGAIHASVSEPSSITFPATETPFYWDSASLTVGGNAIDVSSVTLSCDNMLKTDRHYIRGTNSHQPRRSVQNGYRKYTLAIQQSFYDNQLFTDYLADNELSLFLRLTNGANEFMTIDLDGFLADVSGPNTSGPEELEFGVDIESLHGTADSNAFQITLRNDQSTVA